MKKLILLVVMFCLSAYGYSQYRNIQVNEKIHYMDDSLTNCYIVITDVNIFSLKSLTAQYQVAVYKNKAIFEKNPKWIIYPNEIHSMQITFTSDFTQGDLFYKVSNELKLKLLILNPGWKDSNIIIE